MINNQDWEPKITFLGAFAALIGLEFHEEKTRAKHPDIKLFEEFLQLLPSNGSIQYLRETDMAGLIDSSRIRELSVFRVEWNYAEHEFIDKKIEEKKKTLMQLTNSFFPYYGLNTWNLRGDIQRVPTEWREEQPERYYEVVSRLNGMANEIVSCHQELVRVARRRLRV